MIDQQQSDSISLHMTKIEFSQLVLCMGYATGAALTNTDQELADRILALANKLVTAQRHVAPFAGKARSLPDS